MKNLLRNLDINLNEDEKESIKGIMARVNVPEKEGDELKIHLLVYAEAEFPKKQYSFIVNYSKKYSSEFLNDLLDAQKKGYKLEVEGVYRRNQNFNIRNVMGEIDAEKLSIFLKQNL